MSRRLLAPRRNHATGRTVVALHAIGNGRAPQQRQWARRSELRGKVEEPFELGAFIHLGRCLAPTGTSAITPVAQWHADMSEAMRAASLPLPANRPLHQDDALANSARKVRQPETAAANLGARVRLTLHGGCRNLARWLKCITEQTWRFVTAGAPCA